MRALFHVTEVTKTAYGQEVAKLSAISRGDDEESKSFWEATPSGSMEIHISNPDAMGFLVPGKEYYLTFEPR